MLKRTMIAAVPLVAALMYAPTAHADGGTCTGLAGDVQAYSACRDNNHLNCANAGVIGSAFGWIHHFNCAYPGGGRDECTEFEALLNPSTPVSTSCNYVPPGA